MFLFKDVRANDVVCRYYGVLGTVVSVSYLPKNIVALEIVQEADGVRCVVEDLESAVIGIVRRAYSEGKTEEDMLATVESKALLFLNLREHAYDDEAREMLDQLREVAEAHKLGLPLEPEKK